MAVAHRRLHLHLPRHRPCKGLCLTQAEMSPVRFRSRSAGRAAKAKSVKLSNGTASDTLQFKAPVGDLSISLAADGSFMLGNDEYKMYSSTVGGKLAGGSQMHFLLDSGFSLPVDGELQGQLLPMDEVFDVAGGKWKFAKNSSVNLSRDKTSVAVDESKGKTNRSSLRLTYTSKTGFFRGAFKAYVLQPSNVGLRLKKYTVNVTGFVVDGRGYGQAVSKRPASGPWAVTVE